ncbi:MAG: MFS transporter [Treponema sp.]|jgi:nitrate/nitrite transporter NarK|nr:MFS transporter [Treponema sp.]
MKGLKKYITLLSLSLSYATIYSLVYLKYVLYNPMLDAFGISNAQLGLFMTVYALVCMAFYIPGGYLADKYSTRKILSFSMAAHGLLCFILCFSLNYTTALIVWLLFGFTSAFAFWAALVKGMVSLSTKEDSGRVAGIYALGCAVFSALINMALVSVYTLFPDAAKGMQAIAAVSGGSVVLCAVLVFFFYRDKEKIPESGDNKFDRRYIKPLLKSPIVWILSLVIFCVYGLRVAGNTYFNPYLAQAKSIDLSSVAVVGIIRSNLLPMLTPLAGYLADKVFKSVGKLLVLSFVLLAVMFGFVIFMPSKLPMGITIIVSLLPGAISGMSYGIVFSILREAGIPDIMMGTVIGIVSIIGYLPDFFFDPVLGSVLDHFGTAGFTVIFSALIGIAFAGIAGCLYVVRYGQRVAAGKQNHIGGDIAAYSS